MTELRGGEGRQSRECPACHWANPPDAVHCRQCVTTLPAPPPPPASPPTAVGTAPPQSTAAVLCPNCGTLSADPEYCDDCGRLLPGRTSADAPGPRTSVPGPTPPPPVTAPHVPTEWVCAFCQTVCDGAFCEGCGRRRGQQPDPHQAEGGDRNTTDVEWTAVVTADQARFEQVVARSGGEAAALVFPLWCPPRRLPLSGSQVRIGRGSRGRGIAVDLDLGEPPRDPGVSSLHAVLLRQPDGGWRLLDPGSANGTFVDGAVDPIPTDTPVLVRDGTRIHIGAWTLIELRAGPPG